MSIFSNENIFAPFGIRSPTEQLAKCFSKHLAVPAGGRLRENKSSHLSVGTPTPRERLNGVKTDSTRSIKTIMWRSASRRATYIARGPVSSPSSDVKRTTGDFPRERASPRRGAGRARRRQIERGHARDHAPPAPLPASFHKKWRTSYILNHFNLGISYSTPWDTGVPSWRFYPN